MSGVLGLFAAALVAWLLFHALPVAVVYDWRVPFGRFIGQPSAFDLAVMAARRGEARYRGFTHQFVWVLPGGSTVTTLKGGEGIWIDGHQVAPSPRRFLNALPAQEREMVRGSGVSGVRARLLNASTDEAAS